MTVRIGSGAGFAGDRVEPAVDLARRGNLDDLVLECLAERTIALGQQRRLADPATGHDPRLHARLTPLLPVALSAGTRVLTNMGAANPTAAGRAIRILLDEIGSTAAVGVVTGDDVLDRLDLDAPALEDGRPLRAHGEIVSANAYLGADAILPALNAGAQVVVTGRVADPALFLAPLAHRFGWDLDDTTPWRPAPSSGTCWSVPASSPAATRPIRAGWTSRIWPGSASRSPRSTRTAPPRTASSPAPGAASTGTPCGSNCSTRSRTRPGTPLRTSCSTCATSRSPTPDPIGCGCTAPAARHVRIGSRSASGTGPATGSRRRSPTSARTPSARPAGRRRRHRAARGSADAGRGARRADRLPAPRRGDQPRPRVARPGRRRGGVLVHQRSRGWRRRARARVRGDRHRVDAHPACGRAHLRHISGGPPDAAE